MALINKLEAVGDAIRAKTGKTDLLTLDEMVTEIAAIETGGGGGDLPEEAFLITGKCNSRFTYNGWNWFIDNYGNKVTTKDITTCEEMFLYSDELQSIPFVINCKDNTAIRFTGMFSQCSKLEYLPLVKANPPVASGTYNYSNYNGMFSQCRYLKEIPNDFFWNLGSKEFWAKEQTTEGYRQDMFFSCSSLRKLPDITMLTNTSSAYYTLYYNAFYNCYVLDEINLPVIDGVAKANSNMFYNSFNYTSRLKSLKFATNEDGTPITVNWKSQTIDLTKEVGYATGINNITSYNSGLTEATRVLTDVDYQALKDNEDMWSTSAQYSRYNHDSAVETINSLPDTSAYLASAGGTNTIKFRGNQGNLTDGGAINTLTAEEIAVATAKGWTVSLT